MRAAHPMVKPAGEETRDDFSAEVIAPGQGIRPRT
jgi:hypothetical protein